MIHRNTRSPDVAAAVSAAVTAGAQVTGEVVVEPTNLFQVMLDPEGNEFRFIDRAVDHFR